MCAASLVTRNKQWKKRKGFSLFPLLLRCNWVNTLHGVPFVKADSLLANSAEKAGVAPWGHWLPSHLYA